MKHLSLSLAAAVLCLSPLAAHADLIGSSVTGSLAFAPSSTVNYFTPSTATIGSQVEFSFTGGKNIDSANFSANSLVIDDNCYDGPGSTASCDTNYGFTMTFTDTAFYGERLLTNAAANSLGLTYSLSGDTLTFVYDGRTLSAGDNRSAFAIAPAPAPEPSSLILLGTGLVGAAGAIRRRVQK